MNCRGAGAQGCGGAVKRGHGDTATGRRGEAVTYSAFRNPHSAMGKVGGEMNAKANPLIGTWRLVSVTREAIPSGEKTDMFGPNPIGYISYGADGRMLVVMVRSDRKAPRDLVATEAEGAALFKSMVAYGGRYSVQGDRVVHEVDISWNESWTNTKQTRFIKLDGDRLLLTTPQDRDPVDGVHSTRTIAWEKVK